MKYASPRPVSLLEVLDAFQIVACPEAIFFVAAIECRGLLVLRLCAEGQGPFQAGGAAACFSSGLSGVSCVSCVFSNAKAPFFS